LHPIQTEVTGQAVQYPTNCACISVCREFAERGFCFSGPSRLEQFSARLHDPFYTNTFKKLMCIFPSRISTTIVRRSRTLRYKNTPGVELELFHSRRLRVQTIRLVDFIIGELTCCSDTL